MDSKIIHAILIVIVIVIIYKLITQRKLTKVDLDGKNWNMVGDFKNAREAAQLLARVNSQMIEFMRILKRKYHIDEPDEVISAEGAEHSQIVNHANDTYNIVNSLLDNYNPEVMLENDPRGTKETSYTLNKGTRMYVCLRDKKDPNKLVNENTLTFVILHEASHIANYNGWGHDTQFWEIFKFILHEAVLAGIYKPVDYARHPVNYCGLNIGYQPLYDEELRRLWEM